jgi:hypothetical protein
MRVRPLTVVVATIAILAMSTLGGCRSDKEKRESSTKLTQGFALAITARKPVVDAYQKMGKWPASNEEAGLPQPEKYATTTVSDLTVSSGGVITVRFNAGETLRIMPDPRHIPVGSRWRCVTKNFDNAIATVPCKPLG